MDLINSILLLDSYVILPIVIFSLSLLMRIKLKTAFKSAVYIAVGLIGISMLFAYFINFTVPLLDVLGQHTSKTFNIIDVGWPVLASLIWSVKISVFTIPIVIALNILLIKLKFTYTFNLDIWNYWHLALVVVLVEYFTKSITLALISLCIITLMNLKLADWSSTVIREYYHINGISSTTMNGLVYYPYALVGNYVLDRIPYFNSTKKTDQSGKNIGFLKEPTIVAFFVGVVLAIAGRYSLDEVIEFSLKLTAVFLILPHLAKFLNEGFSFLSEGVNHFLVNKLNVQEKVNIGVNHMVLMEDDALISAAVLLIPLTLFVSFLFAPIQVVPLADLTNIIGALVFIVGVSKGSIIRSVVLGLPIIAINLIISGSMAFTYTKIAKNNNFFFSDQADLLLTSSMNGGNPMSLALVNIFRTNLLSIALLVSLVLVFYLTYKHNQQRNENHQNEKTEKRALIHK